jgi:hypothetical protein
MKKRLGPIANRHPVGARDLVAVFDESGGSSRPGPEEGDDFALGAVIFSGRRPFKDLIRLDEKLQQATNCNDYKYRQVRQSSEARLAFVDAFRRQSGLIRLYGYYAAGGAFICQAEREVHAATTMKTDPEEVTRAEANLARHKEDPRGEGLKDALLTSIPAMSAWAQTQRRSISAFLDDRSDHKLIGTVIDEHMKLLKAARIYGESYDFMDWKGTCIEHLFPVARVADVLVGDIRATFAAKGQIIWDQLAADGFVGRHHEALATSSAHFGPVPMPRVGRVESSLWDDDWESGSTKTTMFGAYRQWLLTNKLSLYSPSGQGCLLVAECDHYALFQQMD